MVRLLFVEQSPRVSDMRLDITQVKDYILCNNQEYALPGGENIIVHPLFPGRYCLLEIQDRPSWCSSSSSVSLFHLGKIGSY